MKMPSIALELPKPKLWDFAALGVLAISVGIAIVNWSLAQTGSPGVSLSGTTTVGLALSQMTLTTLSLLVLGKTAKEGTIWGNLTAVAAMSSGMGGVLLAAALWTAS